MTYLWLFGDPIQVTLNRLGLPDVFVWHNRQHPVQGIADFWRVDTEWWRVRVWRDYFTLYTRTGLMVIVYRDILSGEWYLLRRYD